MAEGGDVKDGRETAVAGTTMAPLGHALSDKMIIERTMNRLLTSLSGCSEVDDDGRPLQATPRHASA
jgi:hypothetical protein